MKEFDYFDPHYDPPLPTPSKDVQRRLLSTEFNEDPVHCIKTICYEYVKDSHTAKRLYGEWQAGETSTEEYNDSIDKLHKAQILSALSELAGAGTGDEYEVMLAGWRRQYINRGMGEDG